VVLDLHWLRVRFNLLDSLTLLSGFDPLSTEANSKKFSMSWRCFNLYDFSKDSLVELGSTDIRAEFRGITCSLSDHQTPMGWSYQLN
jgi:hypothetical protein